MNRVVTFAIPAAIIIAIIFLTSAVWAEGLEQKNISGKYVWETDEDSAELVVELLTNGMVHIRGVSLRNMKQETAGELDFTAPIENERVEFVEKMGMGMFYRLELTFTEKGLLAKEEGLSGHIGFHAKFSGKYNKM
jgi:hypothetical protein